MKLRYLLIFFAVAAFNQTLCSQSIDSLKEERFSIHGQTTVITQDKPSFHAKYSGTKSLSSKKETETSITATLFLGARLWNGAGFFLSPEIAAGSGLSGSLGVAASTNGETYRVSDPAPSFEMGRIYFNQIIPLSKQRIYQADDVDQLNGKIPTKYIALTIGKISLTDIFDANKYSHDPRTQFMSWGLMNNGAWDFAANTKGYTPSFVAEWVTPQNALRYGFSLLPKEANEMAMNWNIGKAGANYLEYTHNYSLSGEKGSIRLLSYLNRANMGSYRESLELNPTSPDITKTEKSGRIKYGFGVNAEQDLNDFMGMFFRASWDDGHTETWAYTEIDQTASMGLVANGSRWNRKNDNVGLATVVSGLSNPHRNYLKAGGLGFELGDDNLNYGLENVTELYYSFALKDNLFISGAYQFIVNPGYNRDRGPVNVFSIRVHAAF